MVSVQTAHKIHKARKQTLVNRKNSNFKGLFHKDHLPATVGFMGFLVSFCLFSLQIAISPFTGNSILNSSFSNLTTTTGSSKTPEVFVVGDACTINSDCGINEYCDNGICAGLICRTVLPPDCQKRAEHSCAFVADSNQDGQLCNLNEEIGSCSDGLCIASSSLCDLKEDDFCNDLDFKLFIDEYEAQKYESQEDNVNLDFNEDGALNILDYKIFVESYETNN
ncbi:hypothetical protein GYA19_04785 [Candidatus Beckwithbacteria bacterium]|nr:hypothetical protein [Candidatus Beckwithbacteria bacterium]